MKTFNLKSNIKTLALVTICLFVYPKLAYSTSCRSLVQTEAQNKTSVQKPGKPSRLSAELKRKILANAQSQKSIVDPDFNLLPKDTSIQLRIGEIQESHSDTFVVIERLLETKSSVNYVSALRSAIALVKNGEIQKVLMESESLKDLQRGFDANPISDDERVLLRDGVWEYVTTLPENLPYKKHDIGISTDPSDFYFLSRTVLPNGDSLIRFQSTLYFNLMASPSIPMRLFRSTMLVFGSIIYREGRIKAVLPDRTFSFRSIAQDYAQFANQARYAGIIDGTSLQGKTLLTSESRPIAVDDLSFQDRSSLFSAALSPLINIRFGNIILNSNQNDSNHVPLEWVENGGPNSLWAAIAGKAAVEKEMEKSAPGRLQYFKGSYKPDILTLWLE